MRRPILALSLLVLVACGGGGASSKPDPVTHVVLVPQSQLGALSGYANWTDQGSTIWLSIDLDQRHRAITLLHECWHLLTHASGHPNPCPCVSSNQDCDYPPSMGGFDEFDLPAPCPDEVAQVVTAGRTLILSFPDGPATADACAEWWNDACGSDVVTVAR